MRIIESKSKLYSSVSVVIASVFGGPLGAGLLIRKNFIETGNEEYGKKALRICITVSLMVSILIALVNRIDSVIPKIVLPLLGIAMSYQCFRRFFGQIEKEHKGNNGTFYSGWNAVAIGILSGLVIFAGQSVFGLFVL